MESISGTNQEGGRSGSLLSAFGSPDVNRDQFLQLLVTQLKNQDPFEPVGNEQFLAQLATFSQLEEQQKTSQLLQQMVTLQQVQLSLGGLSQGAALVGRNVTFIHPTTGAEGSGLVESIHFDPSGVLVEVGGEMIPIGNITGILQGTGGGSSEGGGGGSGGGVGGGTGGGGGSPTGTGLTATTDG